MTAALLVFDDGCAFCQAAARFLRRRARAGRLTLVPASSEEARALLAPRGLVEEANASLVLVEGERAALRSTAALRALQHLRWPWPLLAAFLAVPRPMRDWAYGVIARNRYRWFGRARCEAACAVPTSPHPRRKGG